MASRRKGRSLAGLERRLGHHGRGQARFYVLLILTVLTVSYILVPWVAAKTLGASGYTGNFYEPKDFERQTYLARRSMGFGPFETLDIIKFLLLVLVGCSWLTYLTSIPR